MTDESEEEYRGHGVIKLAPSGANFELYPEQGEVPTGTPDLVENMMNEWMTEMNAEHRWPITKTHIKTGVTICTAEWEPSDDDSPGGYGIDLTIDYPDTAEERWYTHEEQDYGWDY